MFFECQWLILFWAENSCFLFPVALTQSTLKSVGIVLLTSKTSRSSPVPSVVYNFIVKYRRTGNICFKLLFLSFATLNKPAWNQDAVQHASPNERYQIGSRQTPVNSSGAQVQVLSPFFVSRQRLLLPGNTAPSLHAACLWPVNWGSELLHPHSSSPLLLSRSSDQHLPKSNTEPKCWPLKPQLESEKNIYINTLS